MLDAMLDVGCHVYFLFKFRQMREYLLWDAAWLIYIAWPNRYKMSATVRMLKVSSQRSGVCNPIQRNLQTTEEEESKGYVWSTLSFDCLPYSKAVLSCAVIFFYI